MAGSDPCFYIIPLDLSAMEIMELLRNGKHIDQPTQRPFHYFFSKFGMVGPDIYDFKNISWNSHIIRLTGDTIHPEGVPTFFNY